MASFAYGQSRRVRKAVFDGRVSSNSPGPATHSLRNIVVSQRMGSLARAGGAQESATRKASPTPSAERHRIHARLSTDAAAPPSGGTARPRTTTDCFRGLEILARPLGAMSVAKPALRQNLSAFIGDDIRRRLLEARYIAFQLRGRALRDRIED